MTDQIEFEDTEEFPSGRKARVITPALWAALESSAKESVAKRATRAADVIEELKKDLASASVRGRYDVTTSTAALENGMVRLTFLAVAKTPPKVAREARKETPAK